MTMKLRCRSMDARGRPAETHPVQLPDTAALSAVKDFLAAKLSAAQAQPVPAESIRLSLNRSEELLSTDPSATLTALGLASGDLLYFTLSAELSQAQPPQTLPQNTTPDAVPTWRCAVCSRSAGRASSVPHVRSVLPPTLRVEPSSDPPDLVMAEAVDATKRSSSSLIGALKREMEAESALGADISTIHRLVVAVQASLIDAGFLAAYPLGSLKDWASGSSATLTVKYTLPKLADMLPEAEEGRIVVLNYSLMPSFVRIHGCVPRAKLDLCRLCSERAESQDRRLCLELPKLAPLVYLGGHGMGAAEEKEVIELWKVLKDELCLPLMISLCELNGLALPPCLMALPSDLKYRILEFLPGVGLANVECTCKELKDLAGDDNLWKTKFEVEWTHFGEGSALSGNWKHRFGEAVMSNHEMHQQERPSPRAFDCI